MAGASSRGGVAPSDGTSLHRGDGDDVSDGTDFERVGGAAGLTSMASESVFERVVAATDSEFTDNDQMIRVGDDVGSNAIPRDLRKHGAHPSSSTNYGSNNNQMQRTLMRNQS